MSTPANMAERTERGNSKDKTDSSYLDMQLVNQQYIHCTHSQTSLWKVLVLLRRFTLARHRSLDDGHEEGVEIIGPPCK